MRRLLLFLFVLFSLAIPMQAALDMSKAEDSSIVVKPKKQPFFSRFIKFISQFDSNYVEPNHYQMCALMLGEQRFSYYRLAGTDDNNHRQELSFSPNSPFRVGPYLGYSIAFLGYTFDIGAKRSSLSRSNIYLSLYSKLFGIDYYYESNENNYRLRKVEGFGGNVDNAIKSQSFSGMSTYFMNLHVYYLFNNKHFSYPAAYNQSTVQRRSCGSFILGFNYTHEKVNFDYTKLPQAVLVDTAGNNLLNDNLKVSNIYYRNYSISLGYGYNWAFMKNCLANLTIAPALGYNFSKGEKFTTKEKLFNLKSLNFDIISRASLVWNNTKFFAGFSAVAHTYTYKKPTFSMHNSLVTLSVYSGLYFIKKKQYRKHCD